ncbi:Uncharacterised protein [Actinobaculum suis]|uniref:Uncharacterized protein n=1 Tax=Actinobaculum suis TaxID=1657 RepID=A0A7Z8YAI8_9ACTO|nr:hypothetical protein [Actinobaculum suis]VDG79624.1 Uncharacterised protein [Actinobaculum suis]
MENCAFWNGLGPLFIAIGLGFTLGATGAGVASFMARVEIPASEVSAAEKPTREVSGREAPGRAQTVTVYGTLTENARAYRTPWGEESCQASVQPHSITFSPSVKMARSCGTARAPVCASPFHAGRYAAKLLLLPAGSVP